MTTASRGTSTVERRPLEGKLAIVTGASRGLGKAIAANFASKGCSLVLGYTSSARKVEAVANDLEKRFAVTAVSAGGDLRTEEGCGGVISTARQKYRDTETGRFQVDIVVNNAGITYPKSLGAITADFFREIYAINVLGPIFLMQAVLPYLPWDRSGRVVNISSVACSLGFKEQTVYAGSKGALEAMTRVWARELAERAVVNSISPGPIWTDMLNDTPEDIKVSLAPWNQVSPLAAIKPGDGEAVQKWQRFGGRPAYAEEVAGTVAMLCSADAAWTTGSCVSANGGMRVSY